MTMTMGIIIGAVLVLAVCVALIVGITELVAAMHRVEHLLESIDERLESLGQASGKPQTPNAG